MAVWAGYCGEAERCSGIEVVVEHKGGLLSDTITQRGVIAELARFDKKIIGKRLGDINTLAIERFLSRFSNFEEVQCVVTSKGKLRLMITPIVPELRIFDGDDSYYINKDGKRIPASAQFFCEVPIVSGHFSRSFTPKSLLPLTRYIARDPVFSNLIMMIRADSPNDIILVPRIAGHVINIGDMSNIPEKLKNVLLAYREIMPYQGWEKYDTISVKFAGRIVATRRDKSELKHTPDFEQSIDYEEDANSTGTPESVPAEPARADAPAASAIPRNHDVRKTEEQKQKADSPGNEKPANGSSEKKETKPKQEKTATPDTR